MNRRLIGPRSSRRMPGGGVVTNPLIIFGASALKLWLRSDLGITLGTGVSAWADQSGNANHVTQGTGSKQPAFTASDSAFNGKPSVAFDGSDDFLSTPSPIALTAWTVIVVSTGLSGGAGKYFWYLTTGLGQFSYLYGDVAATIFTRSGADSGWDVSAGWGAFGATPRTLRTQMDGTHAGHLLYSNGVSTATNNTANTGNPGTASLSDTFYLGSDGSGATNGGITTAEWIVIDGAPDSTKIAACEAYLRSRYGHY